jgi:hypothetical protein
VIRRAALFAGAAALAGCSMAPAGQVVGTGNCGA